MSDGSTLGNQFQASGSNGPAAVEQPSSAPVTAASQEKLEEVEDIDFLLEEIENKIAPLALA